MGVCGEPLGDLGATACLLARLREALDGAFAGVLLLTSAKELFPKMGLGSHEFPIQFSGCGTPRAN